MKKISIVIVLVLVLLMGAFGSFRAAEPLTPWQQSTEADLPNSVCVAKSVSDDSGKTMEYIVQLPRVRGSQEFKAGATSVKYPVILYLHMSGGDQLYIRYKNEQMEWGIIQDHIRRSFEFPFIVVTPIIPSGSWGWRSVEELAMKALDDVCAEYSVDNDRTYLGGFSLGGMGTFDLAADYPTRWAACLVGAGRGDYKEAGRYKDIPFWIWHGTKDFTVPFPDARKIADTLQGFGSEVLITELPEDHVFTNEIFSETTFNWLLNHTRKVDTTAPQKAFVDEVSNNATFVSGTAYGDPCAKVTVKANGKVIGNGLVGIREMYKVAISKQKIGTIVEVFITDVWGNVSSASTRRVKDLTPPSLTVKAISSNKITGKSEANATIIVKMKNKIVGKGKASKNGSFSVSIKAQKKGTSLTVYASDKYNNKKSTKVKV